MKKGSKSRNEIVLVREAEESSSSIEKRYKPYNTNKGI